MIKYCIAFGILFIMGCSKSGSSNNSNSADPIYGKWEYDAPGGTSTSGSGLAAEINSDGSIKLAQIYYSVSGSTATAYARKSIGTFERNGDRFSIKYSYETCNPVGQEILSVKVSDSNHDQLIVKSPDGSVTMTLYRVTDSPTAFSSSVIYEDKNCNILSKLETKDVRLPASKKQKTNFRLAR